MSSVNFEQAKAYLQSDSGGVNLYDHISDILLKIVKEKPSNAIEVFEHLSNVIKKEKFVTSDSSTAANSVATAAVLKFAAKSTSFNSPPEGDEGAPVQDLMAEVDPLEWAGVSIGKEDSFRLYQNLKKLAASSAATGLRFWGKILGRNGDYFIAEGTADIEADENSTAEAGGPNKFAYWVTSSPCGDWTPLPRVTPAQIIAARSIKRYFTGDLNAKVNGHPPFPGKEINFLRAQIARISSSTAIAPAGVFAAADDDAYTINPVDDAEIAAKEAGELADAGAWVHTFPEVTVRGRCKKLEEVDAEGNPVEDPEAPEEIAPLRSAAEDSEGAWLGRTVGGGGAHSLAVLRSQLWPGAVAVGFGKRYTNIYVGNGVKYQALPHTPQPPPTLLNEFEDPDLVEQGDVLTNPETEAPAEE